MLKKILVKTRLSRWMKYSLLIGSGGTIAGGFIVSETRFRTDVSFDESNLGDDNLKNNKAPTYIEASLVKLLPLKIISRIWGHVNSYELPEKFREPVFKAFCNNYNCVLSEAEIDDLKQFRNLKEFFTRTLKSELRPISDKIIASPCDGTVINYGPIVDNRVDQVKGATYSLSSFFGPITWSGEKNDSGKTSKDSKNNEKSYPEQLLHSPENQLYQTVVYLAPGDYHRFHSPVDWHVKFRRHFSGKLFFVKPCFANWLNDLFSLNERALYIGEWTHGFFSMCAIGAANVGSIEIYFDNILKTNKLFHRKYIFRDRNFDQDIVPSKGEPFGQFNLGSTIVVIFEAPKDFKFDLKLGQRIKYGQPIGFTNK